MKKLINVKGLKHPDISHYEWQGELLEQTDDYVIIHCKPGTQINHHTKNKAYTTNNHWLDFFFKKEWYTVSIEIENRKIITYYCNIALPPIIGNSQISFVDLDLDYVKKHDENWKVVDEDEFELNSSKYNYSAEMKQSAIEALEKLKKTVRNKEFPFQNEVLDLLD
ncbi:DUF402 domain-containing protein [Niallia oryzisoli]|uniref:DUF402 domain-containing protein n=1 Tax=Niallia oryzisoli TaxID=1737571 RepID=UPI00373537D5